MVSLLTVLTIQANETEVATYGPSEGKYGFELYSIIREHYRSHVTSNPVFDSQEIAKTEGENLLKAIKELDLDKQRKELSDKLGNAGPTVEKIIKASKNGK